MSDEDDKLVQELVEKAMGLSPWELAAQRRAADPAWRAKNADRLRKMHDDPAWRANVARASRERYADPVKRAKQADVISKRSVDPVWRAKNADANRKKAADHAWLAKNSESVKIKQSKPVVQIEACMVYMGSRNCGYDQGNIAAVCQGHRHTVGGYHWRYATPEEVDYFWAERERTGTDGPFKLPEVDA